MTERSHPEVESEAAAVAPLESSLMSERLRNRHETNALEQATEHAEATLEKARKYQKRGRDQEAKWRDREAELGGEIHDAHAAARRRRDVATELELEVQAVGWRPHADVWMGSHFAQKSRVRALFEK